MTTCRDTEPQSLAVSTSDDRLFLLAVAKASDSSLSVPPSSSIMGRSALKFGVFLAIMFVLVYTTWHMYIPRHARDQADFDIDSSEGNIRTNSDLSSTSFSTNYVNRGKNHRNRTLTNDIKGHNDIDSVFPFDDDDDYNDGESDVDIPVDQQKIIERHGIRTFFTSQNNTFSDVTIGEDASIPTIPFLDACISAIQIFVKMHKMVLDRVSEDIRGNVKKIRRNYDMMPEDSSTLQEMVLRDIDLGQTRLEGSTTLPLTWLKRTFEFISKFLMNIEAGDEQTDAARKAYSITLRTHHGFMTRGIFKAAFMTLSTRHAFLHDLAMSEADFNLPNFESIAMADLHDTNQALMERLMVLQRFFTRHGLEN